MKYRRVLTSFVGFEGTPWLEGLDIKTSATLDNGAFSEVCLTDGAPLVAGEMVERDGGKGAALFVCAADDPYDEAPAMHEIRFKTAGRKVVVTGTEGNIPVRKDKEGYYSFSLASSAGALIETR